MSSRFALSLILLTTCTVAVAAPLATGCGKKEGSSGASESGKEKPSAPLELVQTELDALGLTMQAPKGATVEGDKVVSVKKGDGFSLQIQKDVFGAKGDSLIIPFEKKRLEKKLVDKPKLQIWEKEMGGETVVLFAMVVKVGDQKYYIQSDGLGSFDRAQVDAMVKAARTLKKK